MSATAFAPATVANVACGFDVLGLALEKPGDTVTAERADHRGVELVSIDGDDGRLPLDANENTATIAAKHLLVQKGIDASVGVSIALTKGLPLASGMGSSAASAVAAVVAVDHLLELGASRTELLTSSLEGERATSGAAHPDNVAACLHGGFVLARSAMDVIELPVPEGLSVALVRPHREMSTKDSRVLLGDVVKLTSAVAQSANLGSLVAGLYTEDWDLIARSLVDHIAEPVRSRNVPAFDDVKRAALDEGALGCSLSGSGPSMFALCRDLETAKRVAGRMRSTFAERAGLEADEYVSPISAQGARICAS